MGRQWKITNAGMEISCLKKLRKFHIWAVGEWIKLKHDRPTDIYWRAMNVVTSSWMLSHHRFDKKTCSRQSPVWCYISRQTLKGRTGFALLTEIRKLEQCVNSVDSQQVTQALFEWSNWTISGKLATPVCIISHHILLLNNVITSWSWWRSHLMMALNLVND